jgi:membrane protein, antimicrobial resistance system
MFTPPVPSRFRTICDPGHRLDVAIHNLPIPPALSQPSAVASAPTASLWEDFIDIIVSPANVFRRRERGSWIVPLIIITIAVAILAAASRGVMQPVIDAEFERAADQMRKNPQFTEEMIERARSFSAWFATYGPVIFTPIAIVIVGFMTWLVAKLVDARQELNAALMVAAYSYVPRVIQGIVNSIQALVLSPDKLTGFVKLSLSPARFLDPATANPLLLQLLARLDLFTIWVTVLLAIGVYVTGRITKGQAAFAGVLFWIVGSLPAVFSAVRQMAAAS